MGKDTLQNELHQVKKKEFEIADALNEVRFALGLDDGITENNQLESLVKKLSPLPKSGPSSKIGTIEGKIIAVETNQKALEGKVDAIQGKVDVIEGKFDAIEANLKDIKEMIVKLF